MGFFDELKDKAEEFGDKAATSAIIQSRPMTWLRRFGPQGTQRQRRWRLAELTAG